MSSQTALPDDHPLQMATLIEEGPEAESQERRAAPDTCSARLLGIAHRVVEARAVRLVPLASSLLTQDGVQARQPLYAVVIGATVR